MTANYWIFPVFLPNLGCPHRCTFCDQYAVTGEKVPFPEIRTLDALFKKVRFSKRHSADAALDRQIAFYGGNFSGLSRQVQKRYLDWAAEKIHQGFIRSIRFSTRPDALGDDEIAFLKNYPVQTVEVGVQSLNDAVLRSVQRGHSAEDCRKAVSRVVSAGWDAGVQLMPGLFGETREGFLRGVETVTGWGIRYARLYPAVILKGTGLYADYKKGFFSPLTVEEAVSWCAGACEIFEKSEIEVIRMGLPASDILKASVVAGPYHPAFGFLVQSFRFHEKIRAMIRNLPEKTPAVQIRLSPADLPLLMGDRREAWQALQADFPAEKIDYYLDSRLARGAVKVKPKLVQEKREC